MRPLPLDSDLPKIPESEYMNNTSFYLDCSQSGHQFAIVDDAGSIISVVGMSRVRYLPSRNRWRWLLVPLLHALLFVTVFVLTTRWYNPV